jgi:flagellar FliL protein
MSDKKAEAPNSADGAAPAAGGGMKALLPLILNVVLMPVMAYVMTVFVLLPKINSGGVVAHAKAADAGSGGDDAGSGGHGAPAKEEHGSSGGGKHGGAPGGKTSVPLSAKVLVNVSGTAGTRYLLAQLTLVGTHAELKDSVEKSDAQLRDVASSVLATKTIADLDKPGSRNLIRTELISAFNGVLGEGRVKEIYFTDFAIQ